MSRYRSGAPTYLPEVEVETAVVRQAHERRAGRFLKGPIAWNKIAAASKLGGQCLAVYLAIHHRIALTRRSSVTLPRELLLQLGVSKDAKARTLRKLEQVELVCLERSKGRPTRVMLNDR
jgi:hypothetical protein